MQEAKLTSEVAAGCGLPYVEYMANPCLQASLLKVCNLEVGLELPMVTGREMPLVTETA